MSLAPLHTVRSTEEHGQRTTLSGRAPIDDQVKPFLLFREMAQKPEVGRPDCYVTVVSRHAVAESPRKIDLMLDYFQHVDVRWNDLDRSKNSQGSENAEKNI